MTLKGYVRSEIELNKARKYQQEYRKNKPETQRALKYRTQFGITIEEYDFMLASQEGVCAICSKPETLCHRVGGTPRRLSVDHDHKTGQVRGLLCQQCNVVLGQYEKWKEVFPKFEAYLKKELG